MDSTELCRLCAVEKDTFVDGFVRIYSDEGQKFGLEKKIIRCLQIELCSGDDLPKSVCLECCSKLHQCADFVESSARAQTRLKVLVENNLRASEAAAAATAAAAEVEALKAAEADAAKAGAEVATSENVKEESSTLVQKCQESLSVKQAHHEPQQNGEDKDVFPSKYVECVVNDDSSQSEPSPKELAEDVIGVIGEAPRSRASKRKCRLPVRVSRVCLVDLDNVDLDADEISRIFADEDSEEDTRRKRKGRKKRSAAKIKGKSKCAKPRARKNSEKNEEMEERISADRNGRDKSESQHGSENGSRNSDGENIDDNGGNEDDDYNSGTDKPKDKGKSKEKKKPTEVDFSGHIWLCSDCSEEFSDVDDLRHHHSEVHKQIPKYMCSVCSKVFSHYPGFVSHYKRHQDYDRYCTCETCGKCFSNKKALDSHRLIHSDKKPYECSVCKKAFRQQSALYVHSRCHLPDELKNKYACDECDKRFSTKPNLITHKRIHTGVRNYTCDQCGKSFVQKGNLDAHLLTHSNVKPFACQLCDKSFKTELQLRKHGSVHTGVKPHQCDICGRQFRERGTLREHHRIHTGAMPFSCEFCGKSFRFKGVLTTHRRQHTGERPYSCIQCQHHFTNWPNYNKHMKRRHGINTANSRNSRTPHTDRQTVDHPTPEIVVNPVPAQATDMATDSLQLTHQPLNHHHPDVPVGPTSTPLSACDSQMQQQPTALLHKTNVETHQTHHLYHHENTLSQHSLHSQEDDSMSSHHEIYSTHQVHSPLPTAGHPTHASVNHVSHLGLTNHPSHHSLVHEDERESKYVTEREILLGQMTRERDRPHFYNPAPGSSVNTNPYLHQSLHQSLHHSLQQTQLPLPGLYAIPQLSLDPSHLEMLHSTATQHR